MPCAHVSDTELQLFDKLHQSACISSAPTSFGPAGQIKRAECDIRSPLFLGTACDDGMIAAAVAAVQCVVVWQGNDLATLPPGESQTNMPKGDLNTHDYHYSPQGPAGQPDMHVNRTAV